jgi:large subunit ribosomal protein L10e
VLEALRRAKYKLPGRQRVVVSGNYGFSKLTKEQYEKFRDQGRLVKDGINVQVIPTYGPLGQRELSKLPLSMLNPETDPVALGLDASG